MTQTFTQEHKAKLEEYLATHILPIGLGTKKSACSIAAINLAVSGTLTDDIPDCMSDVLGKATIRLQDSMPSEMRNSLRYKALLPDMAGTGREYEQERLAILMNWMWSVVLPQLQPVADKHGFGDEWKNMCQLKTAASARAAVYAADVAADVAADAASAHAAAAADAAADADYAAAHAAARTAAADYAAAAADAAAAGAAYAAADAASYAAARAAAAAVYAARATSDVAAAYAARAAYAAADAAAADFWEIVDPLGVLESMTYLNEEQSK
jgi:hypothetical protein